MAVRLRLTRLGAKKRPFYRVIATDSRTRRDGRYLENLGTYDPGQGDTALKLEGELFLAGFFKTWAMGAGPCDHCGTCELEGPCVAPERARPSMEGCGIDVFATVRNAGRTIDVVWDEGDEYRFFALVLVD